MKPLSLQYLTDIASDESEFTAEQLAEFLEQYDVPVQRPPIGASWIDQDVLEKFVGVKMDDPGFEEIWTTVSLLIEMTRANVLTMRIAPNGAAQWGYFPDRGNILTDSPRRKRAA